MGTAILVILDRKEFEERLASYYWAQPVSIQQAFVRAYSRPVPDMAGDIRCAISDILATMTDSELGVLAQAVVMSAGGPAA
jgi:hypothetical protein